MNVEPLSEIAVLALFDGIACALLAGAAALRARSLGAHFTGAVVLGCLCGLIGPLLRESFLHGQAGRVAGEMPGAALAGSLAAIAALKMVRRARLFFWVDAASIGLAGAAGSIASLQELGIVGALTLGLINALAPGLVRDMALGDTAMLVEQDWYATAAALGCLCAIAIFIGIIVWGTAAWLDSRAEEIAILAGFIAVLGLRAWKGRPEVLV